MISFLIIALCIIVLAGVAACWAIAYLMDVLEPDDWDKY